MAKDNETDDLSTPSSSKRTTALRAKPYDANNSFIKKVATKVTDIIPQRSWISKWFNSSQDESGLQETETDNAQFDEYEDKQTQPPPMKRPCIRMDVTHPPGTFTIQPRNRNAANEVEPSKDHFSNHNDTTQDFLEPPTAGRRLNFVASTPAFPMDTAKAAEARSSLNVMMTEQNNNGAANGVDDNSESSESTSGCSSLIPQNNRQEAPQNSSYNRLFGNKRRFVDDKFNFTNHLQSPRSLFLDSTQRETLASRRPSFDPSVMNNSTLNKSASLLSPFYPGNTTFGGANAANLYRSSSVLSNTSQIINAAPQRASVEVNPSNKSSSVDISGMSQTARRILETLEQFSSPLSDARKMPVQRNVMGTSRIQSSPTTSRKRSREEEAASSPKVGLRHLTRELPVPTVPDMLRIRRKQKLQNSTVNARKIAAARSAATAPPPAQQEYHIRTEADVEPIRNTNQLKAKKKTNLEAEETVEAVNLPTIPLPISSLPRFDISLPQATKPATPERPKQPLFQMQNNDDSFKFASPIRLADANKSLESYNNFTFSKPITPSKVSSFSTNDSEELSRTLSVNSNDTLSTTSSFPNFVWAGPTQTTLKPKEKVKEKKEESSGGIKVATELKQGSVMDFFKKQAENASKAAESTTKAMDTSESEDLWECNVCLIKNSGKKTKCVCKTSKPSGDSSSDIEVLEVSSDDDDIMIVEPAPSKKETKAKPTSQTSSSSIFNKSSTVESTPKLSLFNSTTDKSTTDSPAPLSEVCKASKKSTWECPCCMVRNGDNVTTCPCCNTAKPDSIRVSPKRTAAETTASATTTSGFGDKFKKPEGSWTCDTCMVPNKSDVTKCVACETPKAGAKPSTTKPASGFGDMFKKPEGTWSCDVCMLQNKPDVTKCVSCEAAKPGSSAAATTTTSTTASKPSGFGDMFKKPEGSWTCDSCFVSNKADATKCISCDVAKPGTEKPKSNLQFKVDMPANAGSFKFGIDKADAAATLPKADGFNFGGSTSSQAPSGGFSFGAPKDSAGFAFKPSQSVAAAATFRFGAKPIDTSPSKEGDKPAATATFSFGAPPKSDTPATTGFVFGASTTTMAFGSTAAEKKDEKAETKVSAPSTGFSFGAPAASTASITKESTTAEKPKSSSETPTATFVFGAPKPAAEVGPKETPKPVVAASSAAETSKPTLSFGAPSSTESKPAATPALFTFGAAAAAASTSTTTSTPSSTLFTFTGTQKTSEAPATSAAPLPSFGSPAAPKAAFSFGKPAETTSIQQSEKTALGIGSATPSFGSQANQGTPSLFGNIAPTSTSSAPLLFGAPENKTAPSFGEPSAKMSAFGSSTDSKPTSVFPTATATPTFGSSAPAANPTAAASPFGSTGNMFGGPATSTFGGTPASNIFSATTKPSETPAATPGLFTFGGSSQTAAPASGGFNFSAGSNATATSDPPKPGLFSFGASSSTAPVGNGFGGGSTFGAAPTSTASPAATPSFSFNAPKPDAGSFGAATPAPMFNAPSAQPAGPPPAYPGTATPAPAAGGFNFGSTAMPTSFNFGSTPAPASGGFNFNAPNTATAPTFDPNVQPTFNFTGNSGAPTAFNAPPSAVPPSRKIKKAVRRMPRQ